MITATAAGSPPSKGRSLPESTLTGREARAERPEEAREEGRAHDGEAGPSERQAAGEDPDAREHDHDQAAASVRRGV